jgi:hypothetical protein
VIQRRAVVGIVFAASLSMLAACGFEAPTVEDHEHASVQATDFTVGSVHVDDTSIVSVTSGGSAPAFYLVATIVSDAKTNVALTGVTSSQGAVTMSGAGTAGGQLTIPPGVPVQIAAPPLSSPGPIFTVAASPLPQAGAFVPMTFSFSNGDKSQVVQVPFVPSGETTNPTQPVPTGTASVPIEVGQSSND